MKQFILGILSMLRALYRKSPISPNFPTNIMFECWERPGRKVLWHAHPLSRERGRYSERHKSGYQSLLASGNVALDGDFLKEMPPCTVCRCLLHGKEEGQPMRGDCIVRPIPFQSTKYAQDERQSVPDPQKS